MPFLALGVSGRTGGRLAASLAIDGYYRPKMACAGGGPVPVMYQGEEVLPWEGRVYPVSVLARVHYEVPLSGLRLDWGLGGGGFPGTRITDSLRSAFAWHPWFAGTLGLRAPGRRLSGEVEIGRHSDRSLSYLTTADSRDVRSWRHWKWMVGGVLSFQLGG